MIKGMTGFGHTQIMMGKVKAVIEVKSLNHRYFDVNYYLPVGFGSVENKIRTLAQKFIQRGRITIAIKITEKPPQTITLNKEAIKTHLKYANVVKREFKLSNDLTLSDLVKLPGVYEIKENLVTPDGLWNAIDKGLKKALVSLESMRKREGVSLAKDIADKLRRMLLQKKKIQSRTKTFLSEKKKLLNLDEFKSLQKSCDVNEEITRLTHYIEEMKLLLKSKVPVGKKIDFVAQEMQRETNTIGSKLQDKVVSNSVIALKSKIEKIREQAQNIE